MLSFCEQMGHNIPREILLGLCCLSLLCILHQTESRAMCWTCGSHTIHTIEEPGSTSKHSHLGMEIRNSSPEFLHGIASLKISATDWGSLIRFNRVTLLVCANIGLHRYLVVKEKLLIGVLVNLHGQCAGFRDTRRLRHTPVLICKTVSWGLTEAEKTRPECVNTTLARGLGMTTWKKRKPTETILCLLAHHDVSYWLLPCFSQHMGLNLRNCEPKWPFPPLNLSVSGVLMQQKRSPTQLAC